MARNHIDAQIKDFITRQRNTPRHGLDGCADVFAYLGSVANAKRRAAENISVIRFMNKYTRETGEGFAKPVWHRFELAAELRAEITELKVAA